jgi:predicted MPP superfamily phosphohydrolase
MRRFRRVAVVVAILLFAICFVVWTWALFVGGASVGWPMAIAIMALAYIPVTILGFRLQNPILRAAAIPTAASIGFLSFCLVASVLCWIIDGAMRALRIPVENHSIGCSAFGLGLAAAVYGLVNAARIRTTRYMVALKNLPGGLKGKTGVLVSDLHLGNIRGVGFSRRVAAHVKALNPDILFICGDMFDGALVDLDACAAPWGAIKASMGSFFVTGNHDEFTDSAKIMEALRKVGIRILDNEMVTVHGLQVVGVHDGVARNDREFREILARSHVERDCPSVLLSHQPSHLSIPNEFGISLQLSGHTHNGQFWPWSLLVARVFGPYAYGLNRFGGLQVITSCGVGTWGPPMRVATRSEIVLIEFTAA